MRDEIITQYHAELAADEKLTAELLARLRVEMTARHLQYGQRTIGVALRPHLLTRAQYDQLQERAQLLASAFEKAAAAMLAEPALMRQIGLSEREQHLALIEPGYARTGINTRLDGFLIGNEFKFVEYNGENPSSLTDQSGLNQVLFEIGAMQKMAERHRLRQFTPIQSLVQAMLTTWREWGGTGAPSVAILDWDDLPTWHEFMLARNYFAGCGIRCAICSPDELEYSRGRLRRGDFEIDLIYKRVVIHELLTRCDELHPLFQAYRARAVCMLNSFRCKLLHKKAGFALLTDEANQHWFTAAERVAIQHSLPWTRRVSEGKTKYQGAEIDLLEFIRRQRQQFVLKPNDDYGGRGIVIGPHATEGEWEAGIAAALQHDYVVQEALPLQTEQFPVFNEHEWALQPMYADVNPFLFSGAMDGVMVRLSDSPIVNVTSGGGETGFFVLEDW